MLMLKTNLLSPLLAANKIFTTDKVDGIKGSNKLIEKYRKLSKIRKLFKSQKSAKLKKDLLKKKNSSNFGTMKNRPSFLIFDTNIAFNYL